MVVVSWPWTLDVIDNGITSLGEWCDGQDPILSLAQRSCSSYAKAFLMSSIISLDHEIVQLPDTVGMFWVYQTSQRNWVAIKVHYRYLRKCLLVWHESRLGFALHMMERYLWAHSVMHHHNELKVTKWLVTGSCITVRVKWLAGNETEQGIGIPTIESRASNVPIDKGNCIRIDWILDIVVHLMRSSSNMWEPTWVSRSRCWLLTGEASRSCLHVSRTRSVYTLKVQWR